MYFSWKIIWRRNFKNCSKKWRTSSYIWNFKYCFKRIYLVSKWGKRIRG